MNALGNAAVVQEEVQINLEQRTLAGTLTFPGRDGTYPVALLITGSGRVDRDEDHRRLKIGLYSALARALADNGFASLRYDKRGIGRSTGNFLQAGFNDFTDDANCILKWLRRQERISQSEVFLVGHSEGALHSIRLAAAGGELAGLVLLSGSARSGEEILQWQSQQISRTATAVERLILRVLSVDRTLRKTIAEVRKHPDRELIRVHFRKLNAKWLREFVDYDPRADLPRIDLPVLAVSGEKDIQVPGNDAHRVCELVVGDCEAHVIPNLTHIVRRDVGSPNIKHYKRLVRQPVDPEVLSIVTDWLRRHSASVAV